MSSAIFLLIAIAAFAVDQTSKVLAARFAAERRLEPAGSRRPVVRLRCHLNARGGGGLVGGSGAMTALWIAELAALLALVELVPAFGAPVPAAGLGCAVGGAAGNLTDRVSLGGVLDFIDVGFWPVFNLADVAIVAGVAVALLSVT
jgi:signal peptidase II